MIQSMETKISILWRLMAAEDWAGALRLASRFGVLGSEKAAITRGWEATARPAFYVSIGRDPVALVAEGISALKRRYPPK